MIKASAFGCMIFGVSALLNAARCDSFSEKSTISVSALAQPERNMSSGIETLPILSGPIQVYAVIVGKVTNGSFDWSEGRFDSTYLINDGKNVQIVNTSLFGALARGRDGINYNFADRAAVLSVAQSGVEWQSPYLLIPSIYDWKHGEKNNIFLFKLQNSVVRRVAILSGEEEQFPQENRFFSLFPANETGFTHAECSFNCNLEWKVVLDYKNDMLIVNGPETWEKNKRSWHESEQFVRTQLAPIAFNKDDNLRDYGDPYMSQHGNVYGVLIQNVVLAKYCKRDTELNALLKFAHPYLDDTHQKNLDNVLAKVTPLESFPDWNLK